jgi:hypothetical protein
MDTPKTVQELKTAIETLFEPLGNGSSRAWEFVGDQRVVMNTYIAGKGVNEGDSRDSREYYFPSPESAIAATWEEISRLRHDPAYKITREELEDGFAFRFLPSRVIWRLAPELITAPTGIFTVRMRAAFI